MGGRYSYDCMTRVALSNFLTTGSCYVFENRKCQVILKLRETLNKNLKSINAI